MFQGQIAHQAPTLRNEAEGIQLGHDGSTEPFSWSSWIDVNRICTYWYMALLRWIRRLLVHPNLHSILPGVPRGIHDDFIKAGMPGISLANTQLADTAAYLPAIFQAHKMRRKCCARMRPIMRVNDCQTCMSSQPPPPASASASSSSASSASSSSSSFNNIIHPNILV